LFGTARCINGERIVTVLDADHSFGALARGSDATSVAVEEAISRGFSPLPLPMRSKQPILGT